jgi:hypothetical protein
MTYILIAGKSDISYDAALGYGPWENKLASIKKYNETIPPHKSYQFQVIRLDERGTIFKGDKTSNLKNTVIYFKDGKPCSDDEQLNLNVKKEENGFDYFPIEGKKAMLYFKDENIDEELMKANGWDGEGDYYEKELADNLTAKLYIFDANKYYPAFLNRYWIYRLFYKLC